MKNLLSYTKQYKKETILAPLFKLLEALLELLVPVIVASIIDNGIKVHNTTHIYMMVSLMIIIGIVSLMFAIIGQYYSAKASVGVAYSIRRDLFKKITELSYTQIDEQGTSSLITRMTSDVNQVQTGVNLTLRLFLRSPFIVFGAAVMAYVINPEFNGLYLVFAAAILILSVIVFGIMFSTIPLHKKSQKILDGVLKQTRENITGVRVIRANTSEHVEMETYKEKTTNLNKAQNRSGNLSALLNPLTFVFVNLAICALFYFGAFKVNGGIIEQGILIALYNLLGQILVELIKFATLIINITKSIASYSRIDSILQINTLEEIEDLKTIDSNNLLEFKNVSLKYHQSQENALTNLSFSIKTGQTIGIVGGTGSGKTSLVNLIPRFYDYTEGEIYFKGRNLKSMSQDEILKSVAVIRQKAVLFRGTIKENLLWGKPTATENELIDALIKAQAFEVINNKENKLEEVVLTNGKNFSGGQKQRLSIARGLVKNAELIIFDDSSSALDYATDAALRSCLNQIKATKIIISQRSASILNADQIIVLDDGMIVDMGTHEELLSRCELYQSIYYSQYKKEDSNE